MLPKNELIACIKSCYQKKILVIGDIMLDEYNWCSVNRISSEAPVPICIVNETTLVPGGAANVAHNIRSLGSMPYLQGVIGVDSSGDKLINILQQLDIPISDILLETVKPTILKSRIIAHHQHVVRIDRECIKPLSQKQRNKLFKKIVCRLEEVDVVLISDYLKGTLIERFIQRIINTAKEKGLKVIVDPKGDNYLKYKGAYILTPNFHEFETVIKKKVSSEKEIHAESMKLIKKLQLECLLLTRSEKGISIINKQGVKIDIPTKAQDVYDITGAGDTMIGMLSIAIAAGCTIEQAASLANYAAGIVVGKVGTATTILEELQNKISA